ncbi:hypothetical protein H4J38_16745 [Colwellia sp. BRX10-3]|uniref:hypothetical protein n=1 Tax=Colwellia sp. BRX10-3 TaxID=2759844 RepID=UPI0015F43C2E|nr:hypothetical protein [Colwellia sp. BRX10-3]MBA6392418.1 hypothetical protein [Colwellia sp. BRX10-3]
MKRILAAFFGIYLLYGVILSLSTGKAQGLANHATASGRMVDRETAFIEFTVCVFLDFIGGIWALKIGFSNKEQDNN